MRQIALYPLRLSLIVAAALLSAGALNAAPSPPSGQSDQKQSKDQQQKQPQKQQQAPQPQQGYSSSSTTQAEASSPKDDATAKAEAEMQKRYQAEQDIEVADFYIHKGDPDAAIPRLEEAARLRPDYGKPRFMLAECYEKKNDPDNAVKYLKEYLKVYRDAPDAKKVREKIKKLEKQES